MCLPGRGGVSQVHLDFTHPDGGIGFERRLKFANFSQPTQTRHVRLFVVYNSHSGSNQGQGKLFVSRSTISSLILRMSKLNRNVPFLLVAIGSLFPRFAVGDGRRPEHSGGRPESPTANRAAGPRRSRGR